MRAKFIYESLECLESLQFQRGSDPRQVLNIGKRAIIEEWFKDIERQIRGKINYAIDDKLNVIIKQSLWLSGLDIDIGWLPDNLTIISHLDLSGNLSIIKLPNNLTVKGNLYINNTNISKLPNDLKVYGELDIRDTKITTIPDNLLVRGKIYADN